MPRSFCPATAGIFPSRPSTFQCPFLHLWDCPGLRRVNFSPASTIPQTRLFPRPQRFSLWYLTGAAKYVNFPVAPSTFPTILTSASLDHWHVAWPTAFCFTLKFYRAASNTFGFYNILPSLVIPSYLSDYIRPLEAGRFWQAFQAVPRPPFAWLPPPFREECGIL